MHFCGFGRVTGSDRRLLGIEVEQVLLDKALLARREFILQCPATALRLLDRVAQSGTAGLEATLQATAPLMYRFWNPPVMRLGRRARALLSA